MNHSLRPLGFRRDGSPIWPIMGGDGLVTGDSAIDALTQRLREVVGVMESSANTDKARWDAADAERLKIAGDLQTLVTERDNKARADATEKATADMNSFLAGVRTPSKAALAGGGNLLEGHGDMRTSLGEFLGAVAAAQGKDAERQAWGKAKIKELGSRLSSAGEDPEKATIGDTTANGTYIIPNNFVGPIIETATALNPYRRLLTVVPEIIGLGVDIPYEGPAPVRAVVAAFGATKENLNFTVGRYTAIMYTIARIFDLGNQFLRRSQGAAERLVTSKLARAFALGEAYYVLNGSGTGEPKGIITSIETLVGGVTPYVTTFSPLGTTLAGSISKAIATGAGVLAQRSRMVDGVVLNAADWWTMASQGTDAAGFFFAPDTGPQGINPVSGRMSIWGVPCYSDPNMTENKLILGEWGSAQLYLGQGYRVDTSDQAGTRWDTNLTGFRGEEEIGFNADPYVAAGIFQEVNHIAS